MNPSNAATDQARSEPGIGRRAYVAIDGLLKYCINAPLLELPIDFKEWYKPALGTQGRLNFV